MRVPNKMHTGRRHLIISIYILRKDGHFPTTYMYVYDVSVTHPIYIHMWCICHTPTYVCTYIWCICHTSYILYVRMYVQYMMYISHTLYTYICTYMMYMSHPHMYVRMWCIRMSHTQICTYVYTYSIWCISHTLYIRTYEYGQHIFYQNHFLQFSIS